MNKDSLVLKENNEDIIKIKYHLEGEDINEQ